MVPFNGGPTTVEAENRVGHGEKEPNELRWNRANSYYPHARAKFTFRLPNCFIKKLGELYL